MIDARNVRIEPGAPIEEWPAEAIEQVIDRGSLSDWRDLARAIRRDPWGRLARMVETIIGWEEHYGADALLGEVIRRAREDLDRAARERYAARIRTWRLQTGMTLREFARAAGTSASRLSDYERAKTSPSSEVLGRIEYVAGLHARDGTSNPRAARPHGFGERAARPRGRMG